jgi:hypothetical protein
VVAIAVRRADTAGTELTCSQSPASPSGRYTISVCVG